MQNHKAKILIIITIFSVGLLLSQSASAVGISVGWPIPLQLAEDPGGSGRFQNLYYGNAATNSMPGTSLLLLQKNGVDLFKVDINGRVTVNGSLSLTGVLNTNAGNLKVNNTDICLKDGTNCPPGAIDTLGTHLATQNLDMANFKVINLATPTLATDAVTKAYVDSKAGDNLGDSKARANLDMSSFKIINLTTPTLATDATTKNYVDTAIASGASNSGWVDNGAIVSLKTITDKVGIGTNNPVSKLSVGFDGLSSNWAISSQQNTAADGSTGGNQEWGAIHGYSNYGYGVYGWSAGLRTSGAQDWTNAAVSGYNNGNTTGGVFQSVNGRGLMAQSANGIAAWFNAVNGPTAVVVERGNVGIGTLTPNASNKLEVNGQARVTGKFLTGSQNYGTHADMSMGQNCYTPNYANLPGWPKLILQENGYGVFGLGLGCAGQYFSNEFRIISGMGSPVSIGKITNPAGAYIEGLNIDSNTGQMRLLTNSTNGGGNVEIDSFYSTPTPSVPGSGFGGAFRVNEYYDGVSAMRKTRTGPSGTLEMKEWGDWSFTTAPTSAPGSDAAIGRVAGLTIKNNGRVGIITTGNNWNDGTKMSDASLTVWKPTGGGAIDIYGSATAPYDYDGIRLWDEGIGYGTGNQYWGIFHKNSRAGVSNPSSGYSDHDFNLNYYDGANYTDKLTIKAVTGYVGIGTNSPSYKLDVNGVIRGTNVSPSDVRLKENISNISNALGVVKNLRGVKFDWKKGIFPDEQGRQIGLIAQEVEKVVPEVVSTDNKGYKSVNYEKLVPILIEAIKDQQSQIDDLKLELNKIK